MIPSSPGIATFRARIAQGLREDGQIDHYDVEYAAMALVNTDDPELDELERNAIRQLIRSDSFQQHATPRAVATAYAYLGEPMPAPTEPTPAPAPTKLGWSAE